MSFSEEIVTAYCNGLAGKGTTVAEHTGRIRAACDLGLRHRRNLVAHYKAYSESESSEERCNQCWEASCGCDIT